MVSPDAPVSRPALRDGAAVVAAAFLLVGVVLVLTLTLADDEGLLTRLGAGLFAKAPLETLFAQKFRPIGSLLYAPLAGLPLTAFLAVHVSAAATAVLLIGRIASRVGASPVVAALVVAGSPAFLTAAITGQSNSDGVLALAVALYLWIVRARPLAAGVLLGALPWIRYEFGMISVVLAALALLRPQDRRLAAGACVVPALYLGAGALWHGSLIWWLDLPPTLAEPLPSAWVFDRISPTMAYASYLAWELAAVTPAFAVALLAPTQPRGPVERSLLIALAASAFAMLVVPFTGALNFEHTARYLLVLLPLLALAIGRVARGPLEPARVAPAVLLVPLALWLALSARSLLALAGAAALVLPTVIALPDAVRRRRVVVLGALAVVGLLRLPSPIPEVSPLAAALPSRGTLDAVDWLSANLAAGPTGAPPHIVTNDLQLRTTLARHRPDLAAQVRVIFHDDVLLELYMLLDRAGGQLDVVTDAMAESAYGRAAWPCELARDGMEEGTVLVLRPDDRLTLDITAEQGARIGHVALDLQSVDIVIAGPGADTVFHELTALSPARARVGCPPRSGPAP